MPIINKPHETGGKKRKCRSSIVKKRTFPENGHNKGIRENRKRGNKMQETYVKKSEVIQIISATDAMYRMAAGQSMAETIGKLLETLSERMQAMDGIEVEEGIAKPDSLQTYTDSPFPISFNEFKKHLLHMEAVTECNRKIKQAMDGYMNATGEEAEVLLPENVCDRIRLLELLTGDTKNGWIEYFAYEIEFGKRKTKCYDAEGYSIRLDSIENLWELLVKESGNN